MKVKKYAVNLTEKSFTPNILKLKDKINWYKGGYVDTGWNVFPALEYQAFVCQPNPCEKFIEVSLNITSSNQGYIIWLYKNKYVIKNNNAVVYKHIFKFKIVIIDLFLKNNMLKI